MSREPLTLLHASDLQCGKPFVPRAAEALVRFAKALDPDVVVVSGDLTQRAKPGEFRMANEFLERLPDAPLITCPGNHDVPVFRVWERAISPFRNWRRFVSADLNHVTRSGDATFVSLSSAAPYRALVNGRLSDAQMDFAAQAFAAAPADGWRCIVVHHHFIPTPDGEGGSPMPRAARWLTRFEDMGVHAVLGGHVHQTHITSSRDLLKDRPGSGVPLIASGTSASRRARGPEEGTNSFNVIRFAGNTLHVTTYNLGEGATEFSEGVTRTLGVPMGDDASAATGTKGEEAR